MLQPWQRHVRDLEGAWLAIDELRERIDGMQIADEVAARVKNEIEQHRMVGFSLVQKTFGVAIASIAVADFVLSLFHLHHG